MVYVVAMYSVYTHLILFNFFHWKYFRNELFQSYVHAGFFLIAARLFSLKISYKCISQLIFHSESKKSPVIQCGLWFLFLCLFGKTFHKKTRPRNMCVPRQKKTPTKTIESTLNDKSREISIVK